MDSATEGQPEGIIEPVDLAKTPYELAVELHCPKCTGPMVRCQVGYVGIYGWWLERIVRQAGALGPLRAVSSEVVARSCTRCGFTELYAKDPASFTEGEEAH